MLIVNSARAVRFQLENLLSRPHSSKSAEVEDQVPWSDLQAL